MNTFSHSLNLRFIWDNSGYSLIVKIVLGVCFLFTSQTGKAEINSFHAFDIFSNNAVTDNERFRGVSEINTQSASGLDSIREVRGVMRDVIRKNPQHARIIFDTLAGLPPNAGTPPAAAGSATAPGGRALTPAEFVTNVLGVTDPTKRDILVTEVTRFRALDPTTVAATRRALDASANVLAPRPPTANGGSPSGGATAGTTSGSSSGASAGSTSGSSSGSAGPTPTRPPLSPEERQRQAEADDLRRMQLLQAQQALQQQAQRNGGGGGGGGGSGGGSGGSGSGSPPSFGDSGGNSTDVGSLVERHTQDQRNKESDRRNFADNNRGFGNNNSSNSDTPPKDPFKKDDKDGGFKLPEPKADKNAAKKVSKPGDGKTDPLADPSGEGADPGLGYKSNLNLVGPSKVPGLAPKPNVGALMAAAGGGGGGGGGGDNPFAGANVKGGGGGAGAAGGNFEGNPFNSNEGMNAPANGQSIKKISLESGTGLEGDGGDSASSSGGSNDFRKKGTLLDQILTYGPDEEERLRNLGIMAYVSRKERICSVPGAPLLAPCFKQIKSRRAITVEDDE